MNFLYYIQIHLKSHLSCTLCSAYYVCPDSGKYCYVYSHSVTPCCQDSCILHISGFVCFQLACLIFHWSVRAECLLEREYYVISCILSKWSFFYRIQPMAALKKHVVLTVSGNENTCYFYSF
jgi:hypothetical protein